MGSKQRAVEILETVKEISSAQRTLAEAADFEGVIGLQERREELLRELQSIETTEDALKPLADEILKGDSELSALIEKSLDEFKSKLEQIGKSARAVKAYNSY